MTAERLQPTPGAYRQYTIAGIAVGIGLALSALVRLRDSPAFAAVLLLGVALAALACAPLLARNAGVLLEPGSITRTTVFGLSRRFTPSAVFTVLLVHSLVTPGGLRQSAHTAPNLFLLDSAGAPLLRMRGDFWPLESMHAVVAAVGVPSLEIVETTRPGDLRSRFPRAVGWRESHPVEAAVAIGSLIAVLAGGLTVVFANAL
jgi:hypothetical protein